MKVNRFAWKRNTVAALIFILAVSGFCGCGNQKAKDGENGEAEAASGTPVCQILNISLPEQSPVPSDLTASLETGAQSVDARVITKVRNLGYTSDQLSLMGENASAVFTAVMDSQPRIEGDFSEASPDSENENVVTVTSSLEEDLQAAIDANPGKVISLTADTMSVTAPIALADNTIIEGNGCRLLAMNGVTHIFEGTDRTGIVIDDFSISGDAEYGSYLTDCSSVVIADCDIEDLAEKPICILGDCTGVILAGNHCEGNWEGGITLAGNVSEALLYQNELVANYGCSNWMAGITLARGISDGYDDIWAKFDETHFYTWGEALDEDLGYPHDIILAENSISENQAGGIYSDGGYCNYLIGNRITDNQKEGTCLDFGSFGCCLYQNTYEGNGNRDYQTDTVLSKDEVLAYGRTDEGASTAKLPGVSIDNAAYNLLVENTVTGNFGSGIKMVRCSYGNDVRENTVEDNNVGANSAYHFFGIELGGDSESRDNGVMNFGGCLYNRITDNTITGSHYAGIYLDATAGGNVLSGNRISGTGYCGIENQNPDANTDEENAVTSADRQSY